MNILALSWRDPKHPWAGGAEQVMHEHMKGWVKAGHKVTLFSSMFTGGKTTEELDGVFIVRKGKQYLGVHLAAFFYYQKNKEQVDILVDQFHGIPFFTPLYSKKPKIAVLQEVAREIWFNNELPKPINWIVGIIGYLGEPIVFQFYRGTQFMTGSRSAKNDLIKYGINKEKITVIPHGVILNLPKKLPQKEKTKTVCFFGAHTKDKGVEDAIKAFVLLNKKNKFQFWLIGRGEQEYVKSLHNLVENFGITKNTIFWGFVDQKKKFKLLARAHIMLNPSIREGFGLVNIEANAVGTPVVSYKSQGLVDSVKQGESGLFVDKNTPEELARVTNSLLKNKSKYDKLSRTSKKWSKNFSWNQSRKLSLKLLQNLT